jgi:hypothetical protein
MLLLLFEERKQNKPSTCIFERGLIVTDQLFSAYIDGDIYEPYKNIEMLELF